ncbi:hypothetical protein [Escherichia coli]|uniref:hypothetical protein n=1 Tax=Escherichia coli TaxID=562 RepID=UPI0030D27E62
MDTTLSNSSDSDQTVQAVRLHLTRDGQRLFTERYIRNLNELLPVLKRRWDVTPAIIRAVEYLSRVPVLH